jgi:DNA-binding MarR family transcriptional regulator
MWLTDEQQALWREYLAMTGRLQAALNRQLQRDHGLSLSDYDVLVAISERRGCRINELGARLGWEQSRVSHQLRRMEGRGLVERSASAADGRGGQVDLTKAGAAALNAAAPGHAELVRSLVFDDMSATQTRVVAGWLAAVLARLALPD